MDRYPPSPIQGILSDANATVALGQQLGRLLPPGTILLLEGDLGSGKTTLVQGLGQGLGITEPIVSPTFTLVNEYTAGRVPLYHIDLYRLDSAETRGLYLDNYWDDLETEPGIVAIEWSQRLDSLPSAYWQIQLVYQSSGREVQIIPRGAIAVELRGQLAHQLHPLLSG